MYIVFSMSACLGYLWTIHLGRYNVKITSQKLSWNRHVFLNRVQQTVSGNKPSQYPPDTFAGHCLGALWGDKPCPAELSEGVNRVFRTLSGDTPLPILQTPSAGHCLDTHGIIVGRCNSYRWFEWFPCRNFWRIERLGEKRNFLHLRNWQRIISVIVSGQMVIFSGRKIRIALQRQMQILFLSQAV